MSVWLHVIGIGEDGAQGLSAAARSLIRDAETVFGGKRHLELLGPLAEGRETRAWPRPFRAGVAELVGHRGRRTVVMASGDPLWFGVGARLMQHFPASEVTFLPVPSSYSLAAARMGWPLQDTGCISIHGRPVAALALHLAPGARLLCLTSDAQTIHAAAQVLRDNGYGDSRMTVLGQLGGPHETRQEMTVNGVPDVDRLPALNVLAIECRPVPGQVPLSRVAGLPDDAFEHDGKMTKREVRAVALARLAPQPGQHLWDIGAGCGSVAIEWLRSGDRMRATGLEPNVERRAMAARNAVTLGVPGLDLSPDTAPGGLADLDAPDAVFVGGGVSDRAVLDACWNALAPGGRLVANAVTVEGQTVLTALWQERGGDLTRMLVERAGPVGAMNGWRPAMPVMQWAVTRA
ncbi:MAG: precorrin-6y C5,15-methyltransferase (decarboxylating) subunit CbiE [Minwuia sp.]|nr:precorrin-6y C5,15-methyltransferase (decarboxylating) subunit CbiE [Minwuia sp.]